MKHYAHILICTASLACACSFCGCRATYQNDSSTQEQTRLSISDSALRIRTEDACSRFNLNQEEAGKGWKVKVNFDTSKLADPETGLSPISNIEIEGNEKTVKTLLQEDDTIHVSESQETKNDSHASAKQTVNLPQRCRQFCSCRDRQRDQVWPDHRDPHHSYHLNINHPCKIQAKGSIKVKYGS